MQCGFLCLEDLLEENLNFKIKDFMKELKQNTKNSKIIELFGIDLRTLALFRILISLLIIFDIIFLRMSDITAFYSDSGVLPRVLHIDLYKNWYASLYLINGEPIFILFLFLITIFLAFLLLIGFQTKIATFSLWIFMLSLHSRNPLVLTGGDTILHLLLFWSIFLPLGARFSIDSTKSNYQKLPNRFFSIASIAILLQVAFVYFFTAVCKICPEWLNGTALYYALNIDQYATQFAILTREHLDLMKVLSFIAYTIEFIGPILLFSPILTTPIKLLTIFSFFCLQLGIGFCLKVGIFPFSTTVGILLFLPSFFWDKVLINLTNLKLVQKAYMFLRAVLNKLSSLLTNQNLSFPNISYLAWVKNIFLIFCLSLIFLWNIQSTGRTKIKLPEPLQRVSYFLGLEQGWVMFGPKTLKDDFWYVYLATLKNGKKIDLFTGAKKVSWEKPKKLLSSMYKNHRWITYYRNLWVSDKRLHPFLGQYLCREWNTKHKGNEIAEIEFYYFRENILPNNKKLPIVSGLMYKHTCY